MIEKLFNFYTVDGNEDYEEYDYCINCNSEMFYKKINELIEVINEIKRNEV